MTADEFAAFQAKGRKINYCFERADKQLVNDERHEKRAWRHPLFDIVVDVVVRWDCAEYRGRHRRVVRSILGLERNARRQKLEGLSTMARRHQQAIRLVHAPAFDGLCAAEYCRRHGLDKADASRMLAHLYDKEPRLREAISAISACSTVTSWQNRQQTRKFPKGERGLEIVYGFNYRDVADNGWLSDVPSTKFRSVVSGRFKPIAPKAYDPSPERFRPFHLHEPNTWRKLKISEVEFPHFWDALYEPMRAVERYDVPLRYGMFDRYRAISRKLRINDHPESGRSRYRTWRIARAIPFNDRPIWALGHCPQHWYQVPDIWVQWDPTRARYQTLAVVRQEFADVEQPGTSILIRIGGKRRVRLEQRMREARWAKGPMCNPTRVIELPQAREPHGLFAPFTRPAWTFVPVSQVKHVMPILFVPSVTIGSLSDPTPPEGGTPS